MLRVDTTDNPFPTNSDLITLYHIDKTNVTWQIEPEYFDNVIIDRFFVPESAMKDEDQITPRLCCSTTIDGCLNSIGSIDMFIEPSIFIEGFNENIEKCNLKIPVYYIQLTRERYQQYLEQGTIKHPKRIVNNVSDSMMYAEHWIIEPVVMNCFYISINLYSELLVGDYEQIKESLKQLSYHSYDKLITNPCWLSEYVEKNNLIVSGQKIIIKALDYTVYQVDEQFNKVDGKHRYDYVEFS